MLQSYNIVTVGAAILALWGSDAWAQRPPKAGGGGGMKVSHTAYQARPIALGVSGAPLDAQANGYCCGGTLGALVEAEGVQYVLGNWHVLSGDAVSGGNGIVSSTGDPITQPSNIDVRCDPQPDDAVASLSFWVDITDPGSNVDAAIAEVIKDDGVSRVDETGKILEIGTISSTPLAATLDLPVKKSGRSGLSTGKVVGLNASVTVAYEDECAGELLTEKTFTNQILVSPGKFIVGGDSGSLMVENVAVNPRPVGLLYAGSKLVAIANPIDDVLDELGELVGATVTVVGEPSSATATSQTESVKKAVGQATAAKTRHAAQLGRIPGANGHAVGLSSTSPKKVVIKVLVEETTAEAEQSVPEEIDGVPVELWEVGKIMAY